jgi:hypothetical protein
MAVIDQFDFFGMEIELHANSSSEDSHPRTQINLFGGDWRLLGGGAVVEPHAGAGNLLTAMYPVSSTEWDARAKDHVDASPARITAYATAARVDGRPIPADAYQIVEATSQVANHPRIEAFLPADFVLVGGGARANWEATGGAGSILTASRPGTGESWLAAAKDHLVPNPVTITAYAIGLRRTLLDDLGIIVTRFRADTVDASARPGISCGSDEGSTLLVSGGAESHWNGPGILLTASGFNPTATAGGPRPWSWIAQGQEHIAPKPGKNYRLGPCACQVSIGTDRCKMSDTFTTLRPEVLFDRSAPLLGFDETGGVAIGDVVETEADLETLTRLKHHKAVLETLGLAICLPLAR